ncbi:MAG TPA: ubiquinol-cytochrome c reductase iron-sulfur subunit [Gemmataceae bacterium]|nr:ubiquinol-cytochrome c reductase iron-sulfur subunit [Gemmataceae bacterium]
MQRRTFLEWTIHGLGALLAAVLGIPAIAYLIDARNRPSRQTGMRTVAKLSDLEIGVPKEIVIRETRQDAWNLHPDDVVGRVWLVRENADTVKAFSTTCPHLGCSIDRSENGFLCPCHGGRFNLDGKRVVPTEGNNPAPRSMDELPLEKGPAPDYEIRVEYKRFKTSLDQPVEDI